MTSPLLLPCAAFRSAVRRRRPSLPVPTLLLALVTLGAACGGDGPSEVLQVGAISFSATSASVSVGDSTPLPVTVTDSRGNPMSGAALEWKTSNGTIASVSMAGWARGLKVGATNVTASSGTISATIRVDVTPIPVSSVEFTAPPSELVWGESHLFAATAKAADGTTLTDRTITFSSSDGTVLTITAWGQAQAVGPGEAVITAAADGKQATVTVRVISVPIGSIDISPGPATLEPGMEVQQAALLRDAQGQPLPNRPVSWSSQHAAIATINAAGVVKAVAVGEATIVASLDGVSATAVITVVPAGTLNPLPPVIAPPPLPTDPGDGSFSIQVQYAGTPDSRAVAVMDLATARWEGIITTDLASLTINFQANHCFNGQTQATETVDDLLIFVRVINIDGPGQVLARAGPCLIRSSSKLPIVGVVELDLADLANEAVVRTVLTHEIGHVLGIGTLWRDQFGLLHGIGTNNPLFLGGAAQEQYRDMGAGDALVPVEGTGGAGTALGHWRESAFGTELMTGFLSAGLNPLSRVTIGSLRDLGYGVDYDHADSYTLPPSLMGQVLQGALEGPGFFLRDELIKPRFEIDESTGVQRRITPYSSWNEQ